MQPLYTAAPEIDLNLKHSAAPQLASLAARLRRGACWDKNYFSLQHVQIQILLEMVSVMISPILQNAIMMEEIAVDLV